MPTLPIEAFLDMRNALIEVYRNVQTRTPEELLKADDTPRALLGLMEDLARLRDEIGPAAFNKRVAEIIADLEQQCVPPETAWASGKGD